MILITEAESSVIITSELALVATPTVIGVVLSSNAPGRQNESEITMFDSSGISLQDLHLAKAILDRYAGSGATDS